MTIWNETLLRATPFVNFLKKGDFFSKPYHGDADVLVTSDPRFAMKISTSDDLDGFLSWEDVIDEIPDNYSIYILDTEKKKIERYKNLTKVIEDNIKKLSSFGFLLRSDVHIYDSYYYETDDALYFTLTKFKGNSCSKEFENYLAAYSFKSDRIKILRLEADFDYSTFLGLKNNIFYFWNFKEYRLVGITPRDFF